MQGESVSGAGIVRFSGGTSNVNGGSYAVGGTTSVDGGAVHFNTAASTGALTVTSGTLSGTATLGATGNLLWTGGVMDGTGTTTVAGSGSLITGAAFTGLDRTLRNTGVMTYSAADSSVLNFGATNVTPGALINEGTFNVTAGGDFSEFFTIPGQAINNAGTWNVSGRERLVM